MNIYKSKLLNSFNNIEHMFLGIQDKSISMPNCILFLQQIHSNTVIIAPNNKKNVQGDAIITKENDYPIGIKTADCVPIILYEPDNKIIAVVHAGWKGTLQEISVRAVETMVLHGAKRNKIIAAIGPSIGSCCYDIPIDRARKFMYMYGKDNSIIRKQHEKYYLNLSLCNKQQLHSAGIPINSIEVLNICTKCNSQSLYSYRRDNKLFGQNIAYIKLLK